MAYVQYPDYTLWRSKIDGSGKVQLTFSSMTAVLPKWSPDGARIAFWGLTHGESHAYMVAADGTSAPEAIPGVSGEAGQMGPDWSPDGSSLVFSGALHVFTLKSGSSAIHIMDMRTRKVTTLPDSEDRWWPRWSPNGRYIAAVHTDMRGLSIYDVDAGKWADLGVNRLSNYHEWSHDGRTIYFQGFPKGQSAGIFRVRLSDHRLEQVASLDNFRQATGGTFGDWVGLGPDDSPLLVEDVGSQDIYALELKLP
jgi:Tol biopolymer transport system component